MSAHLKPIVLAPVRARQGPDPGTTSGIPNSIPLGPYESVDGAGASACTPPLPPLAYFCIRTLANYADQVHALGSHRIRCQPQVLRALSPSTFDIGAASRCLCKLDPRLWSIIVQVYSDLPKGLQNYHIPLGDRHLPLLQAIPSTPSFALITVLNLARRVSDETSHVLKFLHGLCALDISQTPISHLGIRHFAPTVAGDPSDMRYGTRGLRILRLCNCPKITNQVVGAVSGFQLLTILDLRGTSCNHDLDPGAFRPSARSQRNLFQCSLQDAVQRLRDSGSCNVLFSHPDPFVIHINTEFHPSLPQRPIRQKPAPDTFTFFPERGGVVASSSTSSTTSVYEQLHRLENLPGSRRSALDFPKAERELREWICLMLADAGTETRISKIADFVMQHWDYNPRQCRSGSDYPCEEGDSSEDDSCEEDDLIDSWDEEGDPIEPRYHICGFEFDGGLAKKVFWMVEEALEEHETVTRFYGLDPRAQKTEICHCGNSRGIVKSPAETKLVDRYLMLVRDPPPWDSVYGSNATPPRRIWLATKPSLSSSSNLNLDRSSTRARKSTQEMLGMIAQRRNLPTAATPSSPALAPTISANPFRKDPNIASAHGKLKDHRRGHRNSAYDENPDPVSDNRTPKRMKSIFQIPVPPRPIPSTKSQSQRAKSTKGPGMTPKESGKLKQTTLSNAFGKRT